MAGPYGGDFSPAIVPKHDLYRLDIDSEKTILISTFIPAVGAGEPVNVLDPLLRVLDDVGNPIGEDDNSLDGRNAQLTITLAAGTYFIEVMDAGFATGEYVLSVSEQPDVLGLAGALDRGATASRGLISPHAQPQSPILAPAKDEGFGQAQTLVGQVAARTWGDWKRVDKQVQLAPQVAPVGEPHLPSLSRQRWAHVH